MICEQAVGNRFTKEACLLMWRRLINQGTILNWDSCLCRGQPSQEGPV